MELSEQLRKYRKQENLTQKDLALKLNVSDKTISSWETGRTYPDISLLLNLSSVLHIFLDEFLRGDVDTVEKIDKDLKMKKVYKWWLIGILVVLLIIGGGGIFLSNYQYRNDMVDRFNPLLKTQVGYAALPSEKTAVPSDYSSVSIDNKGHKTKALGIPFKHMVVTDDAWGNSHYLTFQGGLPPVDKPFAMVEHKGGYVSRINFVSWDTIPKSIRNNMFKDYADYRGMYEYNKKSFKQMKGPVNVDIRDGFTMRTGKY